MASNTSIELPDGYVFLPLEEKHVEWAAAIVGHTMAFDSPIFAAAYPNRQTQLAYDAYRAIKPASLHCIKSEFSYGIFDTNFKARYPDTEAETTKGGGTKAARRLFWDTSNPLATRKELLDQMDFPLVAIAMHKDATNTEYPNKPKPSYGEVMGEPHRVVRDALKEPVGTYIEKQVLCNSGIHTRGDHAGKGLSKVLAHRVMEAVANAGYYRIEISIMNEYVSRVWENPPAPYKAVERNTFDTTAKNEPKSDKEIPPEVFNGVKVNCRSIWVILKEGGDRV